MRTPHYSGHFNLTQCYICTQLCVCVCVCCVNTVKGVSPCPEANETESSEAKTEKQDTTETVTTETRDENEMTGVVEGGGEREGMEGEGERKKPVDETGEQAQTRLILL